MDLSKAISYRCAHARVGRCFFCQFNASCRSGGLHKLVRPIWYIAAASETRLYIEADSDSSSTHDASLVQIRIKLSWESSIIESALNGMLAPGIRKDRPDFLKLSITSTTSCS